ncbi:MAG: hypothetical protein JRJ85_13415, partial [Deltaproteobacteria bacterium]|nr:hypothetical protein [Deltaproteobacteria bacterium]
VRFLRETGFVDDMNHLTPDGLWASKLRLDHPLIIAEAIRKGGFESVSPEIMAGCLAPFVWDRAQELDFKIHGPIDLKGCEKAFNQVIKVIGGIRLLLSKGGFESPEILFWPTAALFLWAKGVPWEALMSFIPVDEGDMASLIIRTADHLRQMTNLEDSHHELSARARDAIELIMREPVFIE